MSMPVITTFIASFILLFVVNPDIEYSKLAQSGRYISIGVSYIVFAFLIFAEKELDHFNIDKVSLFLLIFTSLIQTRLGTDRETFFLWIIGVCGFLMVIFLIRNRSRTALINANVVGKGIVLGVITLLLFTLSESLRLLFSADLRYDATFSFFSISQNILYALSFGAILEEFTFRAFAVGYLLKLGYSEKSVFLIQGIIFWLMHSHYLWFSNNPISFFISIPILTLSTIWLTIRYKSIFPAIVAHTLVNALVGPILSIFF